MSWTDILAGGLINPANTVITSYTPLANLTLVWPSDSNQTNVLGDIVELYAYVASLSITLPDATKGSAGGASLFVNKGSQTITLKDATGTVIGTVDAGKAVFVYLSSTGTTAGVWTVFVFAAGSSLAQAAALASNSIAPRGNTLVQASPVTALNSDYTAGPSDQGSVLNWKGGVGTITLSDAGTLGNAWFCHVRNSGTGALTVQVSPTSLNTIDGSTNIIFNPGESGICICDGLNFLTVSKTVSQVTNFSYLSLDVSGTGVFNIATAQTGFSVYRLTGTLTGNRQIVFPTTLAQFTIRNETTGAFTLTVKTAAQPGTVVGTNEAKIVYCDGSDIKPSSTAGIAFPLDLTQGGTGATSAASALTNLGASSLGKAIFQAASATAARAALAFGSLGDLIAQAVSYLQLPSGAAATPMYSFSADPDTGLWSRGANDLGIAIGGTDKVHIDASGVWVNESGTFRLLMDSANLAAQLGYTPVQQGTGVSQLSNTVKLGHDGTGPRITIDATDFGRIWTDVALVQSLGSPGYVRFQNGLTLQWGYTGTLSTGVNSITFPRAFTTPFVVTLGSVGTGTLPRYHDVVTLATTLFDVKAWADGGAASTVGCYWLAVGLS